MAHDAQRKDDEDDERKPDARLTDIVPNEVSFVDRAANLRSFLMVKRNMADTKKQDDDKADDKGEGTDKADGLVLPSGAKKGLLDVMLSTMEKIQGAAQSIGDAETDDAAEVPSEVGDLLRGCAQLLTGAADQFSPAGGDDDSDDDSDDEDVDADKSKDDDDDATDKSTEGDTGDEVAKAGRKISGARLARFRAAHDEMGKLLEELEDAKDDEKSKDKKKTKKSEDADGDDGDDGDDEPTDVTKKLEAFGKQMAEMKAKQAETDATVAKQRDKIKAQNGTLSRQQETIKGLRAIAEEPVDSNSNDPEGSPTDAEKPHVWKADLSKSVAQKNKAKKKAKAGQPGASA